MKLNKYQEQQLQADLDEINRLHEDLLKLEAERDAATERYDRIADESFDTPEEEADRDRRLEIADQEAMEIQVRIEEAEDDFQRANADFDDDLFPADDDADDADESLSLSDAKDIWLSNGMDEDYTFGYTDEELRRRLGWNSRTQTLSQSTPQRTIAKAR